MTGLLTTCGLEFQDWSAEYRLFSRQRWPSAGIFLIRRALLAELPEETPLAVAIDDTLLRKTGLRIPGPAWRRAPLGPHFQVRRLVGVQVWQPAEHFTVNDTGHWRRTRVFVQRTV